MNDTAIIEPLSAVEVAELRQNETSIGAGFWIQATALRNIREKRLYRQYGTFEAYCEERWGFSASRARQIINAAETGEFLMAVAGVKPDNERSTREIKRLVKQTPPEEVVTILRVTGGIAIAENRGIKPSDYRAVHAAVEDLKKTGRVNVSGEPAAFDAAVVEEKYESMKRQQQHMNDSREKKYTTVIPFQKAYVIAINETDVTLRIPATDLAVGDVVYVSVSREKLQEAA